MTPRQRSFSPPIEQQPFEVTTSDDVMIRGASTPSPKDASTAIVLCHGFCGNWRNGKNLIVANVLAERFGVFLFDFRGHGSSDGISTLGNREALDVHAVVSLARLRGFERVVTIGASMGGISVLRAAVECGDVDGVVTISSPANWVQQGMRARAASVLVATKPGRLFARKVLHTRIARTWEYTTPPVQLIGKIDVPLLILHGKKDPFVPPTEGELLRANAHAQARLFLMDNFGHAELSYSEEFARWLSDRIVEMHGA